MSVALRRGSVRHGRCALGGRRLAWRGSRRTVRVTRGAITARIRRWSGNLVAIVRGDIIAVLAAGGGERQDQRQAIENLVHGRLLRMVSEGITGEPGKSIRRRSRNPDPRTSP